MTRLSFGESFCSFGRSNTDLNFSTRDNFLLIFSFPLKLRIGCIAAMCRLEGGERDREQVRICKINKNYSSSHT